MFGYLKDATGTYKSGMLGLTGLCAIGIVLVLFFTYSVRHAAPLRPAVRLAAAQPANGKR
jgi:hypothetical protein